MTEGIAQATTSQSSIQVTHIRTNEQNGLVWSAAESQMMADTQQMAPRAGFEPATNRLTAGCSTTELPGNRAQANAAAYSKDFSLLQRSFVSFFHIPCRG